MLRSGALAWSCTGPCDKILWSSCWNPPQEVIALRPCKRSAPVLVWRFFWDAHREFLYKDLLRSSISKVLVWANAANNDAFFCILGVGVVLGGVVWCGVVGWGGVVWGGVGWCGVVWCGVLGWGGGRTDVLYQTRHWLAQQVDASLQDPLLHLHSNLTRRYKILSCTCTFSWRYATFFLRLHSNLTLRYKIFSAKDLGRHGKRRPCQPSPLGPDVQLAVALQCCQGLVVCIATSDGTLERSCWPAQTA